MLLNKCIKSPQSGWGTHTNKGMVAPPPGFDDSKLQTVTQSENSQFPVLDCLGSSAQSQKPSLPNFAVVSLGIFSSHQLNKMKRQRKLEKPLPADDLLANSLLSVAQPAFYLEERPLWVFFPASLLVWKQ